MISYKRSRVVHTSVFEVLQNMGLEPGECVGASLVTPDGHQLFDADETLIVLILPENDEPAASLRIAG